MVRFIYRPVFDFRARRIFTQKVVTLPVLRGSYWSGNKTTAAIRTDVSQKTLDTGGAERTLIRADASLQRVWWQRFVTMFAAWSEF